MTTRDYRKAWIELRIHRVDMLCRTALGLNDSTPRSTWLFAWVIVTNIVARYDRVPYANADFLYEQVRAWRSEILKH